MTNLRGDKKMNDARTTTNDENAPFGKRIII